ncbi:hypothetical protein Hypma_009686 [Hypsizygus marmoreus]|uniref:Uncharacterized protein n=1 Tax=Hypsizygus marmoreus TaxID=39966 RepID=A0A369JLZ6_HYPMA|nr:hypothetical protein Hypma_009686 [Hypsizygus marmoreus]
MFVLLDQTSQQTDVTYSFTAPASHSKACYRKDFVDDEAVESDGGTDTSVLSSTEEGDAAPPLAGGHGSDEEVHLGKHAAPEGELAREDMESGKKLRLEDAQPTDDKIAGYVSAFVKKTPVVDVDESPLTGAAFQEFKAKFQESVRGDHSVDPFSTTVNAQLAKSNSAGVPVDETDEPAAPVYLEDIEEAPLVVPDDVCGVNDPELQDPLLQSQYEGLPFLPTKQSIVPGWTMFSKWGKQNPNLNVGLAVQSLKFVRSGRYVNPSRIAALHLSTRVVYGSADTRRLHTSGGSAICVSAIFSTESLLITGREQGMAQKLLSGVFHSAVQQSCFGFLHEAQTPRHVPPFVSSAAPGHATGSSVGSKFSAADGMFGAVPAKGKAPLPHGHAALTNKPVLDFDDEVPVFDGRTMTINMDVDLPRLDTKLPHFEGEVPPGSFIIVGYSASMYTNKGTPTLSCSILWAIVCGTTI